MIRRIFSTTEPGANAIEPGDLLVEEVGEHGRRVRRASEPAAATHVAEDKPDEFGMVAARPLVPRRAEPERMRRDTLQQRVLNTRPLDRPADDRLPPATGTTLLRDRAPWWRRWLGLGGRP